jgi:hypothetical protein
MDFKTFWQAKNADDREKFATDAGTTPGYCHQIAFGNKHIELGMADAFVAVAAGVLSLDDLPLTERAQRQRVIRGAHPRRGGRQQAKAA